MMMMPQQFQHRGNITSCIIWDNIGGETIIQNPSTNDLQISFPILIWI